jgi:hypothetical protein
MRAGRVHVLGALLSASAVLSACVTPAIDENGYRGKIDHSAHQLVGVLGVARLAAQLDLDGRLLGSVTDTTITEAENDAGSVLTAFEAVQPPDDAMVTLRSAADDTIQAAVGNLADLRIAMRRGDADGMRQAIAEIEDSIGKLRELQDKV